MVVFPPEHFVSPSLIETESRSMALYYESTEPELIRRLTVTRWRIIDPTKISSVMIVGLLRLFIRTGALSLAAVNGICSG